MGPETASPECWPGGAASADAPRGSPWRRPGDSTPAREAFDNGARSYYTVRHGRRVFRKATMARVKSREQLILELADLRKQIDELMWGVM